MENKQTKDPFLGSMKEITFSKFGPDWFLKSAKGEGKAKDFASVGTKYKCVCCDKEIGAVQGTWTGKCKSCGDGDCQSPKKFHEMQKQIEALQNTIKQLRQKK